jgi:glutathione S-transferase
LEELGVEYRLVEIDKTQKPDSFQALYRRANPLPGVRAKVPLLHVVSNEDDLVLCESTVIAEYLAHSYPSVSYWPDRPKERAQLRLWMELCGSSFSSYLEFTRVQDAAQVEQQYSILKENLKQVDAFLATLHHPQFTLAEAHLAPFVQRCCGILPEPYHPVSIAEDLDLVHLQSWIPRILERKSVRATAPPEDEIERKRSKLVQRLARIQPQQRQQ